MAGHTDNSIVIDAPFELVWNMTNELSSWPRLFTEYAAVEILRQDGNAVRFSLTMHPNEQGRIWKWVSERELDHENRCVRGRRIETGVFKYMNVFWEYVETDHGIIMRWVQDFEMKPHAFTNDVGMTDHLNRTSRAEQAHIKALVEKATDRGLSSGPGDS